MRGDRDGSTMSPRRDPKGPKIEKIQDRPPGFKFSVEIENFNLDPQQPLLFVGNSEGQD